MKKFTYLLIFLSLIACRNNNHENITDKKQANHAQLIDSTDMTNNFYDNVETYSLPVKDLVIEGEIGNPGKVDFSGLTLHSVIVKEALLDSAGGDRFVGAYRYDGYSLFDILDKSILKKKNSAEFRPIIDLYVEVENADGQKVVFSWGEIYYPNNLHRIIIASKVARIVPSKTKELWPLPQESKIIAGNDLVTERNISSPVKITVRSYSHSFVVRQGLSPMYAEGIDLFNSDKKIGRIESISSGLPAATFNTIFYGRGKGIHSTTPFSGVLLKDVLGKDYPVTKENLKTGLVCIAGKDGYRSVLTFSELFNRNDQQEFMMIKTNKDEDGGLFRIFAASDFFSDRAIKSVSEIRLTNQTIQ
jgi:hypothetical protein